MTFSFKPYSAGRVFALTLLVCVSPLVWAESSSKSAEAENESFQELTPAEVAATFAEKLADRNPEDPGAVAAELKSIWDANLDESEAIKEALAEESEKASAAGNDHLAETLTRMIEVLNRDEGADQEDTRAGDDAQGSGSHQA